MENRKGSVSIWEEAHLLGAPSISAQRSMAEMIPDSVRKDASRGEKGLFAAFRDILPDDFIVWHEPNATTSRPDFVILSATHGLLVVEAKG